MFDFPSSGLTVGQVVTNGAASYRWDGVKWTTAGGAVGVTTWNSRAGAVTLQQSDLTALGEYNDIGRNLVHNGRYDVWQRGGAAFTAQGNTADRWFSALFASGDAASITQYIPTDAERTALGDESMTNALRSVFTGGSAAGNAVVLLQRIENVYRLSAKTITVSFYAVATAAGVKLGVSLDQAFGTGGSPSPVVSLNGQSATLSTTWARYSFTFSLPSVAGKTTGTNGDHYTGLDFWYSSGATNAVRAGSIGVQSGTVTLWGVQLEIGSMATPLAKRDPADELALCQRFYQVGAFNFQGYGITNTQALNSAGLPVSMRASPTLTPAWNNTNISSPNIVNLTSVNPPGYYQFYGTVTATGQYVLGCTTFAASADL